MMTTLLGITILLNIIAIFILSAALFLKFESPKNKATFGYIMAGSMIFYLVFLSLVIVLELILKNNTNALYLILCLLSPFVIGKLVKYETVKKYTVIQILCFCAGFIGLILI